MFPLLSLVVVANPLGLLSNTYFFASGLIFLPSNFTSSLGFTLKPISLTTVPFTETLPTLIYMSASLREQIPEFAMYLFKRIPFEGFEGFEGFDGLF